MAFKTDETRELILKVATGLFIKRGFKSVTMADLEAATGLTKGAFYHHFKDKIEIFEAAIKRIINGFRLKMEEGTENRTSLRAFISAYINHITALNNELCAISAGGEILDAQFGAITADIYTYIPDFLETISAVAREETDRWERVIFRAREQREIRTDIDLNAITNLFLNIPDCIKRNRIMGVSLQDSLVLMNMQYEQLYWLLK